MEELELKLKPNHFKQSSDVEKVAKPILNDVTKLANICYLLIDKDTKYLGKCCVVSKEFKLLTGYDYLIIIQKGYWKSATLKQKQALLFHELEHIIFKPTVADPGMGSWACRRHDIEEFNSVVKRFGQWDISVSLMEDALDSYKSKDKKVEPKPKTRMEELIEEQVNLN
jgi:hypothetical protein